MNVIDRCLLWFFMLPATFFKRAGVNVTQLKAILSTKLTMDNRISSSFGQLRRTGKKKATTHASLKLVLGSLFMGLFLLYSFSFGDQMLLKLSIFFSLFILFVSILLITDFTSVLIDIRDNLILLPKPISDATFLAVRLLHIMIRISIVVIPLSLPACIASFLLESSAIIVPFLLLIFLSTLFSVFVINSIYLVILKITTPAKFQSIISYIQIGFAVVLYAGFQILPRIINQPGLSSLNLADISFLKFFPPFWFAESCLSLAHLNFDSGSIISLILSLLVPVLSIWMVITFLAPSFNSKLTMISAGKMEQSYGKVENVSCLNPKHFWVNRLAGWLTERGSEYMGFVFAWKMMGRSRDFKMKVYPSFGYVVVLFVMMFYRSPFVFSGHSAPVTESLPLFFLMYFSSFVLINVLQQLPYSDKFRASWLLFVAPIESPGKVICGALKSAMVSFSFPISLLVAIIGFLFWGIEVLPQLILGFMNGLTMASLITFVILRKLPFSHAFNESTKGSSTIRSLLILLIPLLFGGIHWLISGSNISVVIFFLISCILFRILLSGIQKFTWEVVTN